jgi:flagellar biosynthetic protein FlhB
MAAGGKDDKTEEPTEKRIKESQKKGQMAKSQDLVAWGVFLIGIMGLEAYFGRSAKFTSDHLLTAFQIAAKPDQGRSIDFFAETISGGIMNVLPLTLMFMGLSIIGYLLQSRMKMATKKLKPDFKKLNPLPGLKRMVSPKSWVEAGKQIAKMSLIGYLAYSTIFKTAQNVLSAGPLPLNEILMTISAAALLFMKQAAAMILIVGIFDYFWQKYNTKKGMKMSKKEVKDETKQQDLPAEVRGKIKSKQRELSRNRMLSEVKNADVVVVNPVHIAMALVYDPVKGAPKVVAKGAGAIAERIKDQAAEDRVPIVQDVFLARALHASCDLDDEIPLELFETVANVLAFVFGLQQRGRSSGEHKMPGSLSVEDADRKEAIDGKPKRKNRSRSNALANQKALIGRSLR